MPQTVLAKYVQPGDHLVLKDEVKTVLAVDPNLDGHVEIVLTDGTIRIFRITASVEVLVT